MARILIIDDDDLFRMMLRDMLEMEGFEVSEAENGDKGMRAFRSAHPDLVITDILMPDKEGMQTIRELQKDAPGVKIIAISGGVRRASAPDYLTLAEDFGADRTFPKPFDRIELIQAIHDLVQEPRPAN